MAAADTVTLIGEGSTEWEFDLPLGEVFADQVRNGKLTPKTEDDRAALADLFATDGGEQDPVPAGDDVPLTLAQRIDALATHADANALAAELGVDGFEEKKPTMDAKREALRSAAASKEEQGQ